jgi:hypothetical protein
MKPFIIPERNGEPARLPVGFTMVKKAVPTHHNHDIAAMKIKIIDM